MTITYFDLILAVVLIGYLSWLGWHTVPGLLERLKKWRNSRWEAKANALLREQALAKAIEMIAKLATEQKALAKALDDHRQVTHSWGANTGKWAAGNFNKLWEALDKKEDKLSSDDKFMKDAELSNQVTRIAQHAARKAVQDDMKREELLGAQVKSEKLEKHEKAFESKPTWTPIIDQKEISKLEEALKKEIFDMAKKLPKPIKFKKAKK